MCLRISQSQLSIDHRKNKFFDFFIELRESYVNRTFDTVYFAEIRSHDTLLDSSNNTEELISIIREQLHKEALEIISTVKEVADL